MPISKDFFALVAGAGAGTGRSIALRFAKLYPTVVLARRRESFEGIVNEIKAAGGTALGIVADVNDPAAVRAAFGAIKNEIPNSKLAAAVYNVNGGFAMKPFLDLKPEDLEASLDGTVRAGFTYAQHCLPLLLESVSDAPHPPSLIITGATASLKASANFASFAAGKFALRALSQSLAREFGPRGVHIAHVIIDGLIDTPRAREFVGKDQAMISPDSIAESYWYLHTQDLSAFTQELDLRPCSEKF
ncbi:short-chain dehydrogenase [Truncatella angustata]|uniref:Short-chain dehydrogenase n=1 Tax=Truncatella angustata TaxID=152316 RepID=A0A9P8ZWN8_9PEZI|nr:short-chain dehydrogenase [Truncatella angustata]KAH6652292.1 short-chain dehydrogenase [Truncatella angustata]KAH8205095.1 hypothetical protein TruAng_000660 [Truncatella angustata]